jgi:MFS family permease
MMRLPANRRVLPYYLIQFLSSLSLGVIIPVFVLYFRHRHLNLFEIAALAAIFEGSIVLFELPTGLVANLYGRKLSVVLSFFVIGAAGVIFRLSTIFWALAVAEIVQGLGETLKSGAFEAWMVDSLKEEGQDQEIRGVFARGVRFERTGYLLGLVAGGAPNHGHLVSFHPGAPALRGDCAQPDARKEGPFRSGSAWREEIASGRTIP